jgi:hypothetical protein
VESSTNLTEVRVAIKFLLAGLFLMYGLLRYFGSIRVGSNIPYSKLASLPQGLVKVRGKSYSPHKAYGPLSGERADACVVDFSYPALGIWLSHTSKGFYHDWYITDGQTKVLADPRAVHFFARRSFSKYVWPWSAALKERCQSSLGPGEKLPYFFFLAEEIIIRPGEEVQVVAEVRSENQEAVLADGDSSAFTVTSIDSPPNSKKPYILAGLGAVFLGIGSFALAGILLDLNSFISAAMVMAAISFAVGYLTFAIFKYYKR